MPQHWKYRAEISKTRSCILSAIQKPCCGIYKRQKQNYGKNRRNRYWMRLRSLLWRKILIGRARNGTCCIDKCGHSTSCYHKKIECSCRKIICRAWDSLSEWACPWGTETKILERQYRECVTVCDGCDGIFDNGGGIKITVTTVTYRHGKDG